MKKSTLMFAVVGALLAFSAGVFGFGFMPQGSGKTYTKKVFKPGDTLGPSEEVKAEMRALRAKHLAYKGTEIKPALDAVGEELDLQQAIAAAFNRNDPQPKARNEEFKWVFSADQPNGIISWHGIIQKTRAVDGSTLVEIRITPWLAGPDNFTYTLDYCIETWKWSNGELTFVKTLRPPDAARIIVGM